MSETDTRHEPDPDWAWEAADLAVEELVLTLLIGPQKAAVARGLVARRLYALLTNGVRPTANYADRAERAGPGPTELPWTEWSGGERPVAEDTRVEVRFRDGASDEDRAGYWDWSHEDMVCDIVAYRPIRPTWRRMGDLPSVNGP